MKIVVNTSHQRFGGAVQVALSFINECKSFTEHEFFIWVGPGVGKSLREDEFPNNFHFEHFDFGIISVTKTFNIQKTLKAVESRINPDVIILTSGPSYFHSIAPQIIGFNLPLYIYPESPYVKELSISKKLKKYFKKQVHYYFFRRDATFYVVQTDDVNKRVRRALKTDKVLTVTNTANGYFRDWKKYPNKLGPKSKGVFRFLTVTSFYPHKNLEIIPQVLANLKKWGIENIEFVLTLKQEDFEKHIGLHKYITNIGPINPEECPSLYQECDAMFLPTLAECFSASYPEAMLMEKPIVTTDLGFARSICGDAALFYEAKNTEAAAKQIQQLVENRDLRNNLIAKGKTQLKHFDTPKERAHKYIELCERLVNN